MKDGKNNQLELFRLKVRTILEQYRDNFKFLVAEYKLVGTPTKALANRKGDEKSRMNWEWEALRKTLKKECAGLINRIHIQAYKEGL